jgi:hypothetical protein
MERVCIDQTVSTSHKSNQQRKSEMQISKEGRDMMERTTCGGNSAERSCGVGVAG